MEGGKENLVNLKPMSKDCKLLTDILTDTLTDTLTAKLAGKEER